MKRIYLNDILFDSLFKWSRNMRIIGGIFARRYGCDIPREVEFGKDVHFPHRAMGVVIHPLCKIGNNVCIQHHVLLGEKNGTDAPTICDNVVINPYSIIIGNVTIGENSVIGAGSIVTKDVPANCVYYNQISPVIRNITPEEREKLIQ